MILQMARAQSRAFAVSHTRSSFLRHRQPCCNWFDCCQTRGTGRTILFSTSSSHSTTTTAIPTRNGDIGNSNHGNTVESLRKRLLQEALKHVPTHGWTSDAIAAAAATASGSGVSMASAGLVTVPDLIAYSMDQWNEKLRLDLRERTWELADSTSNRIVWALRQRLSYVQEFVKAGRWHEGMAVGAHPDSLLQTQGQLATMIDIVLQETLRTELSVLERLSLGAVYVAVELHMLADKSPDFVDTWMFLQQRVEDWEKLRTCTGSLPFLDVPKLMQSHTPSDLMFTASAVGSALASGAMSILMTNSSGSGVGGTSAPFTGQGHDFGAVYGTHPSHYAPRPAESAASQN